MSIGKVYDLDTDNSIYKQNNYKYLRIDVDCKVKMLGITIRSIKKIGPFRLERSDIEKMRKQGLDTSNLEDIQYGFNIVLDRLERELNYEKPFNNLITRHSCSGNVDEY